MQAEEGGVWRWNVDDVWMSFSSMFQEAQEARRAMQGFGRYHHLSAALLFGGCTVEALLNSEQRRRMAELGATDEAIVESLRKGGLTAKLTRWPKEVCGVDLAPRDRDVILDFLELRNHVTHRKRRDHSLYMELDAANVEAFVLAVQRALVTVYAGRQRPFPYWVLGWNFVGMNGDAAHPCLLNNVLFQRSLARLGFGTALYAADAVDAWEGTQMVGLDAFLTMKTQIYAKAADIEPAVGQPPRPRLCKRWWDREFIYAAP